MNTLEDLIKEKHDDVSSWKLESDGLYPEMGERLNPFDEEIVERALTVAVKMSNEKKIPKGEVYFQKHAVYNAFTAILNALWKVGHPDAVNPKYIEDLDIDGGIPRKGWTVVYEKGGKTTEIAEV